MSKKLWFILGVLVLAVAACSSNDQNIGVTVQGTPTPIPSGTTALVTALYHATPQPNQTIVETTELNGAPNTSATPIASQVTDSTGATTFVGLTPGNTYCWYFDFVVSVNQTTRQSFCTNSWESGVNVGT